MTIIRAITTGKFVSRSLPFILLLASPMIGRAQENLPSGSKITGGVEQAGGWITAKTAASVIVPLPPEQDVIRIRGKSGTAKAGLGISLKDAQGKTISLGVSIQELRAYWGKHKGKSFPDASLQFRWPGGKGGIFVRPRLVLYNEEKREELSQKWDSLPPASQHPFVLELRRTGSVTQVWMDGQFLGEMPTESTFVQCQIALASGAALSAVQAEKSNAPDGVLTLPIASYARPGAMENAQIKLLPEANLPPGFTPAPEGAANIAIAGLGRIPAVTIDLESHAWRRSAVDALPEARLFSLPLATYSHAVLLCAAEDDPAKTPSFTARLTRYGVNRGDAMADTVVKLPQHNTTESLSNTRLPSTRRVGEVTYGPANARKTTALWLVRVPLKSGQIQDLLYDDERKNALLGTHRYLEFELMDPLQDVETSNQFPPLMGVDDRVYAPGSVQHYRWSLRRDPVTREKRRPDDKRSSVHVFGAALEESPASLEVRANTPFLVFYASDKPELRATVEARKPGNYGVQWEIADVDGRIVAEGKKMLSLSAAKAKETVAIPVTVGNGWYAMRFQLADAAGEVLVEHQSSFVFLPPDTRKAGFESPYGTWWFHWAHGGEPNIERIGPLMQRAGLRHTQLPDTLPEEITKKYGVTAWVVPWRDVNDKAPLQERLAEHEALIRKYQKLWPGVNTIKVWHESSAHGAPFPSEMWGETPPPLDEKSEKAWQESIEYLTALAKMVREKFPHLKLQYGNSGSSLPHIGELLRRKFPREYIGSIASEDLGQVFIPETGGLFAVQDSWFLRETARKLGYDDIPITASHEWMGRRAPSAGLKNQAEWYIRDALHALAYGFDKIALGTIHDAGGGYFHSIWGASGFTRRYPVMEPRPSYAAIATHTRVLDGAKFERNVPTDSLTLYVLEFRRGNEWVYALWTPRGQREVSLHMAGAAQSTLIDLYGREKTVQGSELKLSVATGPQYLVSPSRIASVVPGKAVFPDDVAPKTAFIVDAAEKAGHWTLAKSERYKRSGSSIPHRRPGDFELREVVDEDMGACLELELKPQGELWDFAHEYVFLKLNTPPVGPGKYKNAGIWVKGNGGWGEVAFMAESEKKSFLTGDIYYQNWSGQNAVNFEGWNFLQYPLERDDRWKGKGTITGLLITMPRKMLHLTESKPVAELKIRIKGLSLF